MKKLLIIILLAVSLGSVQAQNQIHVASFSQFQQYFNPALTGQEGSLLKTFYRNQWTGFEDAPRTWFISSELDLADVGAWSRSKRPGQLQEERPYPYLGAQHALGFSILHDSFGPYRETQLYLSYSSKVRLSEKLNLRAGAAITYNGIFLDYLQLTLDQSNDPEYEALINSDNNKVNKVDVNVGVALTGKDFYLGYALRDAAQGKLTTNNDLNNAFSVQHIVQAGYRKGFSEQFGLVANGLFRYDNRRKETAEGQLKGVFLNTFWVGGGYRLNLAYTLTAGWHYKQFKLGYTYENVTQDARQVKGSSNEIVLTYDLVPPQRKVSGKDLVIW